ncbi:MAG: TonB-dependent receptor, partial [Pseudomonadales bacterium]
GSPGIESIEPSVGLYIDNISFARPRGVTQNPFYDMERIEVLRGPQGTLWGRNTIAGAINMLTARPSEEFEAYVNTEVGNYDAWQVEGAVSGPITDTLSGRLSAYTAERDGYLENDGIGPDGGGIDSDAYRVQLQWQPNESLRANLKWEQIDHSTEGNTLQLVGRGPDPFLPGVPNDMNARYEAAGENFKVDDKQIINGTGDFSFVADDPRQENKTDLASLVFAWEFSGYTLTAQTGYADWEAQRVMEFSGGALNVIGLRGEKGDTGNFWSQELRLQSPQDCTFHWVAGVYYDDLKMVQTKWDDGGGAIIDAGSVGLLARNGDVEKVESYSGYFEGSYEITEQWTATAGVRVGKEKKDFTDYVGLELVFGGDFDNPSGVYIEDGGTTFFGQQIVQPLKRDDDYDTWSAKLQYQMNDDTMLYLTAATGYKSGGYNNAGNTLIIADKVVEPEDSLSYEAGAKMDLADGRGRLNIAIFYTTFDDLQVARSDTTGVIVTTNAAEAVTQGIELEGAWRLTDTLTAGGSIAWLDAEYEDFKNAPCGPFLRASDPVGCMDGQDLSGETLQRAPDYSGTVYLEFTREVGAGWDMDAYAGYTFRDDSTTVISNEFGAESLELLDARLSFSNQESGWMVALKGNNLTDERKLILRQDNDLLQGGQFGAINMPRTYALQVRKNF